jgi:hypothetical protein
MQIFSFPTGTAAWYKLNFGILLPKEKKVEVCILYAKKCNNKFARKLS